MFPTQRVGELNHYLLVRRSAREGGLKLIEHKIPDLVLMDIQMPKMSGYDAIKEIRKRGFDFPVFAQTAYAIANERINILASGCDAYLSKPINPEEIKFEISHQLSGRN